MDPAGIEFLLPAQTQFALSAHFIETDRREWSDQGEAGSQWEEQRQQLVMKGHSGENQAGNGIDDAEKDDIGPIGGKIFETFKDDLLEIGDVDPADRRWSGMQMLCRLVDGLARMLDCLGGMAKLVPSPFEGVADGSLTGRAFDPLAEQMAGSHGRWGDAHPKRHVVLWRPGAELDRRLILRHEILRCARYAVIVGPTMDHRLLFSPVAMCRRGFGCLPFQGRGPPRIAAGQPSPGQTRDQI